ncbi:MAG: DinB family protein [Chloroflexota bacterium]
MSLREDLRIEIESTRGDFRTLLAEVPDETLTQPSANPAWTIGELFYHMSLAPRLLVADVSLITRHRWVFGIVKRVLTMQLFNWFNERYTRRGAQPLTRKHLTAEYDRALAVALNTLDQVSDEDLTMSLDYPAIDPYLSGNVTVERVFRYVRAHFDEHAAQIRASADLSSQ